MRVLCAQPNCLTRVKTTGHFPAYCDEHTARYYLAGPMTGYPDYNFPAFHTKAALLREAGYEVLNPAENFDGDTTLPYTTYMRAALELVMVATAVVLLPGWEESKGATLEVTVAQAIGIPVYESWPEEKNELSRPLR